jgi:hypothetical protein
MQLGKLALSEPDQWLGCKTGANALSKVNELLSLCKTNHQPKRLRCDQAKAIAWT